MVQCLSVRRYVSAGILTGNMQTMDEKRKPASLRWASAPEEAGKSNSPIIISQFPNSCQRWLSARSLF
jgi:hypothetical protein